MTNDEWCESFEHRVAKNIKRMREKQNMTKSALSRKTKFSWKTIENWELEKSTPSVSKFFLLCKITGWSPSDLIGGGKDGA